MSEEANPSLPHAAVAESTAKGVMVATALLVGAYFAWFWIGHRRGLSNDPADWAYFGDYFGGIAGPVIAFFALVWLLRSVGIQAKELAETREALAKSADAARGQLNEMRASGIRAALVERAETVYREWLDHLTTEQLVPYAPTRSEAHPRWSGRSTSIMASLGELAQKQGEIRAYSPVAHHHPVVHEEWQRLINPARCALRELCHYLDRVDELSHGQRDVTDYFRRRAFDTVHQLWTLGYIYEGLMYRMVPSQRLDVDILTEEEAAALNASLAHRRSSRPADQ